MSRRKTETVFTADEAQTALLLCSLLDPSEFRNIETQALIMKCKAYAAKDDKRGSIRG